MNWKHIIIGVLAGEFVLILGPLYSYLSFRSRCGGDCSSMAYSIYFGPDLLVPRLIAGAVVGVAMVVAANGIFLIKDSLQRHLIAGAIAGAVAALPFVALMTAMFYGAPAWTIPVGLIAFAIVGAAGAAVAAGTAFYLSNKQHSPAIAWAILGALLADGLAWWALLALANNRRLG